LRKKVGEVAEKVQNKNDENLRCSRGNFQTEKSENIAAPTQKCQKYRKNA